MTRTEALRSWLAAQRAARLWRGHRTLIPAGNHARVRTGEATLVSFASNDYLGLAHHPAVIAAWQEGAARWGVGAGASALVSGYGPAHAALEAELAAWLGFAAARVFGSGYLANLGVLTAFAGHSDTAVFADKLVHASLIDGLQLAAARGASVRRYPHGDLAVLERWLTASRAAVKLIVTDAVFSMDGDEADLAALSQLAARYDAWLVIDDAHGIGVLGENGRGTLAAQGVAPQDHWLYVVTFGKALGVAGAAVLGSAEAITWLDQAARSHIYTTALPPAAAEAVRAAIQVLQREPQHQARLHAHIAAWQSAWHEPEMAREANACRIRLLPSRTAIQPLLIGDSAAALAASDALRQCGFLVPAIRPPTVPPGSARLRVSLSAAHTDEERTALLAAIRKEFALP